MSRSIRKNLKNNQSYVFSKYSEAEFYDILDRLKAEATTPGRYCNMTNWYKRWTYEATNYAEYNKRHVSWLSRIRRSGWTGASKYCVNTLNRSYRYKAKRQLNYATETENWDDVSWLPFIKDADWYY